MAADGYVRDINGLLVRLARGDARALDELFAVTKRRLFVVALSYLDDRSKAEDVLSESYVKVVKGVRAFDAKRNGYNWLYEIVKNTALNQNAKDRAGAWVPIEDSPPPVYADYDGVLNAMVAKKALSVLDDGERAIVYEYFFEGKSIKDIAVRLGKPKTTAYDALRRIIEKMKKVIL